MSGPTLKASQFGVTDTAPQYNYFLTDPSFIAAAEDMTGGTNAEPSSYGTIYSYQAGYASNGNILTHSDSVMGTWNFSYDAVDRLLTAQNTVPDPARKYAGMYGCWTYDAYGNRTMEAVSTTPCANGPVPQISATYNQANNRILTAAGTAFVYDTSGNTVYDGWNEYWYDGEGQLCAV